MKSANTKTAPVLTDIVKPAKYYSGKEVAAIFGVAPVTINRLIRAGRLPAVLLGGTWRILGESILAMQKSAEERALAIRRSHALQRANLVLKEQRKRRVEDEERRERVRQARRTKARQNQSQPT